MIAVIDYGVGNLRSVCKSLKDIGHDSVITNKIEDVNNSSAIVMPGVGAFSAAMDSLRDLRLVDCIKENARSNKPILGICLGMQLLYDKSYEDGEWEGLGLLGGEVVRLEGGDKIPHMGWNNLIHGHWDVISAEIEKDEYAYFVHSYYVKPWDKKDVILWTEYGVDIPAVIRRGNIIGMQFHPEKSSSTGLKLLENFGRLITC